MKVLDALNRIERAVDQRSATAAKLIEAVNIAAKLIASRIGPICGEGELWFSSPYPNNRYYLDTVENGEWNISILKPWDGEYQQYDEWDDLTDAECSIGACHDFASDLESWLLESLAKAIEEHANSHDEKRTVVEAAIGTMGGPRS